MHSLVTYSLVIFTYDLMALYKSRKTSVLALDILWRQTVSWQGPRTAVCIRCNANGAMVRVRIRVRDRVRDGVRVRVRLLSPIRAANTGTRRIKCTPFVLRRIQTAPRTEASHRRGARLWSSFVDLGQATLNKYLSLTNDIVKLSLLLELATLKYSFTDIFTSRVRSGVIKIKLILNSYPFYR